MSNITLDGVVRQALPISVVAFLLAGTASFYNVGGSITGIVAFASLLHIIIFFTSK